MSANDLSLAEAKTSVFITSPNVRSPARPKNRRAARSHSRRVPDLVLESIVPVTILVIWDLVTRLQWVDPVFMPTPLSVARAFYDLLFKDRLLLDLKVSGITVLEGFTIGAGLGLATGIAAGLSSTVDKLIGSILNSIRQVPPLAFLPLIILWAGAGDTGKIVVVSKAVFFPVFMNTLQGIRSVAREYVEVGRIFEYPRLRMLRKVILPAALPSIFVGIRYGAGMAWFMIIAAEMLGGRHGLGYLLTRAQELLLTDQLLLVIVIIGLIGFSVDVGLRRLERRLLRWKRGFEG
jgi:sulfonate transport system permease protein